MTPASFLRRQRQLVADLVRAHPDLDNTDDRRAARRLSVVQLLTERCQDPAVAVQLAREAHVLEQRLGLDRASRAPEPDAFARHLERARHDRETPAEPTDAANPTGMQGLRAGSAAARTTRAAPHATDDPEEYP